MKKNFSFDYVTIDNEPKIIYENGVQKILLSVVCGCNEEGEHKQFKLMVEKGRFCLDFLEFITSDAVNSRHTKNGKSILTMVLEVGDFEENYEELLMLGTDEMWLYKGTDLYFWTRCGTKSEVFSMFIDEY